MPPIRDVERDEEIAEPPPGRCDGDKPPHDLRLHAFIGRRIAQPAVSDPQGGKQPKQEPRDPNGRDVGKPLALGLQELSLGGRLHIDAPQHGVARDQTSPLGGVGGCSPRHVHRITGLQAPLPLQAVVLNELVLDGRPKADELHCPYGPDDGPFVPNGPPHRQRPSDARVLDDPGGASV